MAAPRKYGDELRERATRMAVELRQDPVTRAGAIPRVAGQLGMHPETLRNWVRQAEIDGGVRPGTTTSDAQRLAELEQEKQRLDAILADSATYDESNKTLLTDSLKRQGEVMARLAEVESAWLDAQEAIDKIA